MPLPNPPGKVNLIRVAMAANIAAVLGPASPNADLGFDISATILSPPNAPGVQILKGETDLHQAMNDTLNLYSFIARAILPLPADEFQQNVLDELLSPESEISVKAALEQVDGDGRSTLDGLVADITVVKDSGHRLYKLAGIDYLGADFTAEVYA